MSTAAHPPVQDPQPDLLALGDDHARALALAAQRPTETLGPIDGAWLAGHLATCAACAATAAAYEADRVLLRGLRDRQPSPPRDLWARTSAAMDRERGRAVRDRRAAASSGATAPRRRSAWSPGILSGLLALVLITGSSLLGGLGHVLFPTPSSGASGPAATPIAVLADIGWIQSGADGSFDVYLTQVNRVCPQGDAAACAPLHDVARTSIALGAAPRSVSLSPNSAQLVVVASNGGVGGSVYVVAVPAASQPAASPRLASVAPGASPTPVVGASFVPGASSPPSSPGASTVPGGAITIAEGVIVVGGTAAHSPDGAWFAFAARPADGSTGPDIYVWHVGDPKARAITTDHRSIFSAWLGGRILGSRIDDASVTPAGSPAPATSFVPTASSSSSGSLGSTPGQTAAPSATPPAAPTLGSTSAPSAAATGLAASSAGPAASVKLPASPGPSATAAASGSPSIRPGFVIAKERGVTSFLLDPATGAAQDLAAGQLLRPIVDPTGAWVLYWEGTVVTDAQGVDWMPGTGRLVVAPWAPGLPIATVPAGSASPGASGAPSTSPGPAASARPVTATVGPTIAPTVAPSAIPASSPGATRSPGAAASLAASPNPSGSPSPSTSPSTAPAGPKGLVDGPLVDFDAAFDPSGTHLAVWVANPVDPSIGSLTLFTLADGAWQLDPMRRLVDVPALRGFAIGAAEVVWVTPADASGQGSRIEVVGWTKDGFGTVQSVPGERLVVIR